MDRRGFLGLMAVGLAGRARGESAPQLAIRLEGFAGEERAPVPRVAVKLLRRRPSMNLPWPLPVYSAITDEQGWARFDRLEPGVYTALAETGTPPPGRPGWQPAYLGGADSWQGAVSFRIGPEEPPQEYVMELRAGQPAEVRGVVFGENGRGAPQVVVRIFRADLPLIPAAETSTGKDGFFSFPAVWPGACLLRAEAPGENGTAVAEEAVQIRPGQPLETSLRLESPFPLEGRILDEEAARAASTVDRFRVHLLPARGVLRETAATPGASGQFQFHGITPGRYRILPTLTPPGYYLDRVLLAGVDVLGEDVDLRRGYGPVEILFSPDPGSLAGAIEPAGAPATAVVVPADPRLRDPFLFLRTAPADGEGRFEAPGLRPGEYLVWAFDRADVRDFEDSLLVEQLRPQATKATVRAGESSTVRLKRLDWAVLSGL